MAIWIGRDENKPLGPFDGVLIVLNIGNENFKSLPEKFVSSVRDAVGEAHAAGWLVLYLFDFNTVNPPPDEFDNMPEMDAYRRLKDVWKGKEEASFALLPTERNKEFLSLAGEIIVNKYWTITRKNAKIIGSCSIASEKTLMPLTEIK